MPSSDWGWVAANFAEYLQDILGCTLSIRCLPQIEDGWQPTLQSISRISLVVLFMLAVVLEHEILMVTLDVGCTETHRQYYYLLCRWLYFRNPSRYFYNPCIIRQYIHSITAENHVLFSKNIKQILYTWYLYSRQT